MSNTPVDRLLESVGEMDVLADAVDAHLDEQPLPVDEAVVQMVSARLMDRIAAASQPEPRRWGWGWGLAMAAAAVLAFALIGLRARVDPAQSVVGDEAVAPDAARVEVPDPPVVGAVRFEGPERSVVVAPGSDVITREDALSAVVLVRQGEAQVDDGTVVPEGHWTLLRRLPDGASVTVTFPDGQAPPALHEDVWGPTEVQVQLESARWEALPPRTLEMLDALLMEDSP